MSDLLNQHKDFAAWAEDIRKFPYEDSVGKTTIGIGRNLDDKGVSDDEIDLMFANDQVASAQEATTFPWFSELSDTRKLVVIDMIFNMGLGRFSGFVRTIAAIEAKDYRRAAMEMQDSKWFRQTGRRAKVLVRAMMTDELVW